MPPRSNKAIFAMYAAVIGGFLYVLWAIVARSSSGDTATVAMEVNKAITSRRNDLIQQAAFRAQAAARSQQAATQATPTPAAPAYTPPTQTYTPPAPTYVRPRTTIS